MILQNCLLWLIAFWSQRHEFPKTIDPPPPTPAPAASMVEHTPTAPMIVRTFTSLSLLLQEIGPLHLFGFIVFTMLPTLMVRYFILRSSSIDSTQSNDVFTRDEVDIDSAALLSNEAGRMTLLLNVAQQYCTQDDRGKLALALNDAQECHSTLVKTYETRIQDLHNKIDDALGETYDAYTESRRLEDVVNDLNTRVARALRDTENGRGYVINDLDAKLAQAVQEANVARSQAYFLKCGAQRRDEAYEQLRMEGERQVKQLTAELREAGARGEVAIALVRERDREIKALQVRYEAPLQRDGRSSQEQ